MGAVTAPGYNKAVQLPRVEMEGPCGTKIKALVWLL